MIIKGGTVATPVPYKEYVDARVLTASDPNNDGNIVLKYGASVEGGGSSTGGGDIVVTDEQIANAVSNYMAENPIDVGVKTVNGVSPDKNGNVDVAGGTSNNILYEWDDNKEYTEKVNTIDAVGSAFSAVKVSHDTPVSDYIVGKTLYIAIGNTEYANTAITGEMIYAENGVYSVAGVVVVVTDDEATLSDVGVTLTKGVWFVVSIDGVNFTKMQILSPDAGTGGITAEEVQTMIDNSLGVIENGTY